MQTSRFAIITDGSLPENTQAPVDKVIPFFVLVEGKEIRGDQISSFEFLELQRRASSPPSTAMVREIDFLKEFQWLYERGFRRFVVLTVPANKSGTFAQANLAAERFKIEHPDSEFLVFDTGTTAGGVEFMAQAVALIKDRSLEEIGLVLRNLRERIELFLVLDTVEFIGASGRVVELSHFKLRETLQRYARGLAAWFAARTHHSPKVMITFNQGKEKIAGFGRFYLGMCDKIVTEVSERIRNGKEIEKVVLFHSGSADEAQKLARDLEKNIEDTIQIRTDVSIALLSITGPKFTALFCLYK